MRARVGATTLSMSSALPSEMPYCWAREAVSLVEVTVWVSTEASKPPSPTALFIMSLTCCCRLSGLGRVAVGDGDEDGVADVVQVAVHEHGADEGVDG